MRQTLIVFAILLFLCSFAQTPVKIRQIESSDPVIISYNTAKAYIWGIQIPFEVEAYFNSNDSLWVSDAYNYVYEEFAGKGLGDGWKLAPLKINSGEQYISKNPHSGYLQHSDTCHYLIWARYSIKPDSDLQDSLSQYVEQMQSEGLTSLNIGSLGEFKKKHPQIVDRLLKADSIGLDIRKIPRKFIDFIAVPIEY